MSAQPSYGDLGRRAAVVKLGGHIRTQPLIDWINDRLDAVRADNGAIHDAPVEQIVADELGVSARALYRYRYQLNATNEPTDFFWLNPVETMLDRAGVRIADLYPEYDSQHEDDAHCPSCRQEVTPVDGICPWCSTQTRKRRPGERRRGNQQRINNDHLTALHRIHVARSIPTAVLARQVWHRYGYANDESCDEAIRRGWKRLGLERLPASASMKYVRAIDAHRPLDDSGYATAVWLHTRSGLSPKAIASRLIATATCTSSAWLESWLVREFRRDGHYCDLSPGQREVLRLARRPQGVTARIAARVVHANPRAQPIADSQRDYEDAADPTSTAAGYAALRGLSRRGLIYQPSPRGPWHATTKATA